MLFFSSAANGVEGALFFGGAGGGFWSTTAAGNAQLALFFTVFAGIALAAAVFFTTRGRLKSPWSRRKRKHALSPQQWRSLFTPDGKFRDGGVKFLKKVRSAKLKETGRTSSNGDSGRFNQSMDSPDSEDVVSARESLSSEETSPYVEYTNLPCSELSVGDGSRQLTDPNSPALDTESSDTDSSEEVSTTFPLSETREENDTNTPLGRIFPSRAEVQSKPIALKILPLGSGSSALMQFVPAQNG
ncbi:hypothetical protein LOK49_LG07G00123 [Camellia lanceoleosa]|uniref:Uncharacterized protein n=1 Tax=Camellia lanceoleosa TaxID=1840588 RepID=A0ACC0H5X4_9ERIC|nr:hypothetical protein LOK49_LG07G00123 [Camellia lanceoleosa]